MFLFLGNGWILITFFDGIWDLGFWFLSQRFNVLEENCLEVEGKEKAWNKINSNKKDALVKKSEEIWIGIKILIKLRSENVEIIKAMVSIP